MSRQDLLSALEALHHHPDGSVKKQASAWLEQWGYTVDAWSICDGILHDANATLEARIFCAQTLRTKVHACEQEHSLCITGLYASSHAVYTYFITGNAEGLLSAL